MSISHWGMFDDSRVIRGDIPLSVLAFYFDWVLAEMVEHSQGCS